MSKRPLMTDAPAGLLPLLLGTLTSFASYQAAGVSLGLFFGGVAFSAILIPPLSGRHDVLSRSLFATLGTILGIACVWLLALNSDAVTMPQWSRCSLVLLSFGIALAGLSRLLTRLKIHPAVASATLTIAALLWLAWPIWLPPQLTGESAAHVVAGLVQGHPLFAVNSVLIDQGVWTQQKITYRLTSLGQDIPYVLPKTVWACGVLHGAIGVICLLTAQLLPVGKTSFPARKLSG